MTAGHYFSALKIVANECQISEISPGLCPFKGVTFQTIFVPTGLSNLDTLKLGHNQIMELGAYVFRELPRMSSLDLESNRVSRIDDKAFSGLEGKKVLQLLYAETNGLFPALFKPISQNFVVESIAPSLLLPQLTLYFYYSRV